MNKKNILVGQSGGPTAVINGSLYGVICEGARHSDAVGCVYGMINGIEGFLADSYMNLSETLSDDDLELLRLTPAAYLGSCRFKLPEICDDREIYDKIFSMPPFRSIIAGLPGTGIGFEIITYIQPVSVIIYHFLARNR